MRGRGGSHDIEGEALLLQVGSSSIRLRDACIRQRHVHLCLCVCHAGPTETIRDRARGPSVIDQGEDLQCRLSIRL